MRRLRAAGLLPAALLACGLAAAAGPERVEVPPPPSSPAPLVGHLFRPAGAGPHPAVVMMHGCGGAYTRDGALSSRHAFWGEQLAARGYVALMLDSFTSRGLREICTIRIGSRPIRESDRVADANAALAFLRNLPGVRSDRIGLIGWSHGGGTVLTTMARAQPDEGGFRAAVAMYPGCGARAKNADRFHPYAPVLLIIGEADDWTPAAPCRELVAAVAARGEPMSIVTYPDTYHGFDTPSLTAARVRTEVPNGVNPGRGVTVAPNPEAREDALRRVGEFFGRALAP